ncbi:hypothetical protein D3C77_220550 [compost metagenome]
MPTTKAIIYLDSADYSTLSAPNISGELEEAKKTLLELSASNKAIFVFSGAHISEMAPTQQIYADRANSRTNLLATLCNRNVMISFDKLIQQELGNLIQRNPNKAEAIDTNGSWFPDISDLIAPLQNLNITGNINDQLKSENLNRNQRRNLKRTMEKNGRIRSNVESKIGKFDINEFLGRYPMRPKDAITLKNYIFGKASRAEAESAFLESLRDPTWMMQWFSDHYDRLGPIGDLVRKPAENLVRIVSESILPIAENSYRGDSEEKKELQRILSKPNWQKSQDVFLLGAINRLLDGVFPNESKCTDVGLIDEYCPGISTCLRVIHNSLRNSLVENPRKIKNSDIVDAFHSIYIPYVTHFKTDNYMTGLMKPFAEKHGTTMVSDLSKLNTPTN